MEILRGDTIYFGMLQKITFQSILSEYVNIYVLCAAGFISHVYEAPIHEFHDLQMLIAKYTIIFFILAYGYMRIREMMILDEKNPLTIINNAS